MENMKTIAVQVPEDLFQRIKEYLQRNNMTQKQFLIGLIEDELERDQMEREDQSDDMTDEDDDEEDEDEDEEEDEYDEEEEEEDDDEEQGPEMGM